MLNFKVTLRNGRQFISGLSCFDHERNGVRFLDQMTPGMEGRDGIFHAFEDIKSAHKEEAGDQPGEIKWSRVNSLEDWVDEVRRSRLAKR